MPYRSPQVVDSADLVYRERLVFIGPCSVYVYDDVTYVYDDVTYVYDDVTYVFIDVHWCSLVLV